MFSVAEILTPQYQQWAKTVKRKGAVCTQCSARHFEAQFKMCRTCRSLHWERLYDWRVRQKKNSLCRYCVGEIDTSRSIGQCEYHLEYNNELQARLRDEQAKAGRCTWGRCRNAPLHGRRGYCEEHLRKRAEAA